jgi:hypothetical protein
MGRKQSARILEFAIGANCHHAVLPVLLDLVVEVEE